MSSPIALAAWPADGGGAEAPDAPPPLAENRQIAARLREMADLLQAQGGNPYRAAAYVKAAQTLDGLGSKVRDIFERDVAAQSADVPGLRLVSADFYYPFTNNHRFASLLEVENTL